MSTRRTLASRLAYRRDHVAAMTPRGMLAVGVAVFAAGTLIGLLLP